MCNDRVGALSRELGVETLDLLPGLRSYHQQNPTEQLYFNVDWHLSPAGHRAMAAQLHCLLQEELGSPAPVPAQCTDAK